MRHLAGELFKMQGKLDMLHVPYKGSGQSIVDLVSGQVQLNFDTAPTVINYVKAGKLNAIREGREGRQHQDGLTRARASAS